MKFKKLHVFIVTLLFGAVVTIKPAFDANFNEDSIHGWVLNALLVAAIVGFIAMKYLKYKGMLEEKEKEKR